MNSVLFCFCFFFLLKPDEVSFCYNHESLRKPVYTL
jgi:hypothetical protein